MVERKYNVYMDNEIMYRNLTKAEAEKRLDELMEEVDYNIVDDEEEHFYAIKPV